MQTAGTMPRVGAMQPSRMQATNLRVMVAYRPPTVRCKSTGSDQSVLGCNPNATECRDRSVFLCTPTGQWIEALRCPNACSKGACTGSCIPGMTGCSVLTPQTCSAEGQWENGAACPYLCRDGKCVGACIPTSVESCGAAATCNASAVKTCDENGVLGACSQAPSSCLAVPATWEPVAVTTTTCPAGFGGGRPYYTNATGGAFTCSCGCAGTQACSGSVTLNQYGSDAGAGCSGTPSTRTLAISTSCAIANYGTITAGNSYTISGITYGPGPACTATPSATAKPAVVAPSVTLCSANTVCPTGACLSVSEGANLCVQKAGTNACPAEFPTRTIMSPTYDDTRDCGACACGSTLTCSLTGVLLDNDYSCDVANPYNMTATDTCTGASVAPSSYPLNAVLAKTNSTGTGACAMTAPSLPTGKVVLRDATTVTVCCK